MITLSLATLLLANPTFFVVNDDRDVIQQALLSTQPTAELRLETQFSGKARRSFSQVLATTLQNRKRDRNILQAEVKTVANASSYDRAWVTADLKQAQIDIPILEQIQKKQGLLVQARGPAFVAPPLVALSSMQWDKRIVMSAPGDGYFTSAYRPVYSAQGEFASVTLSIPGDEHFYDRTFFFARSGAGWQRLCVTATHYL